MFTYVVNLTLMLTTWLKKSFLKECTDDRLTKMLGAFIQKERTNIVEKTEMLKFVLNSLWHIFND